MKRVLFVSLLLVSVLALCLTALPAKSQPAAAVPARGFSIVRMEPDIAAVMKAAGKTIKDPFPNSANQGKKFNPGGELVPPLVTAPEQNVLVLFASFTTPPPGGPETRLDLGTYFDPLLFGNEYNPQEYIDYAAEHPGLVYPTDRTLKNYYSEVSYGKIHVTTKNLPSEMGWAQLDKPYAYFVKGDNGFGSYPGNVQDIVVQTVKAMDTVVDFNNYAVEVGNIKVVPNLFVVYPGTGAEWSGDPNLIWSHSWDLSEGTDMTNGYMTDDGVYINNYAMMPEVGGDLTGYYNPSGPFPPTVGVFAHEYGHVLGLPDQYDYGYESDGTGIYSLMAGGSWNRYPSDAIFDGNSPAQLDAWSKYRLGVVDVQEITGAAKYTLPPVETNPIIYKMTVPFSGGKEYYLFENRQNIGFDQGLIRMGEPHGLAIYHVDDTVFTRTYWRPNEAENWKEIRSAGWRKAPNGETHYGISLIQADDRWDLEHYVYTIAGFKGDLYPGPQGKTEFSSYTKPNSSSYYFWGGSAPKFGWSGVTVKNIKEVDGNITADFSFKPYK